MNRSPSSRIAENCSDQFPRLAARPIVLLLLTALIPVECGCNRAFYRRRADTEAYSLVDNASAMLPRPLDGFTIDVDPRSRMYDPYNPDFEPMPPDDPTSHQLMHFAGEMKGYPRWHDNGDTPFVENPYWLGALPSNEKGQVVLDADGAVRVALLNSPDYQESLEELYLSALDVSFERFRFDHQFFGGYSAFFTADGRKRAGSGGSSRSVLDLATFPTGTDVTVRKLYGTGAEMVVGLANSLVWQFSGPDTHSATTLLDFTLFQPLLRGAGRDRVMERLTIVERTLLANVRQLERFRRGFFVEVVTGENAGQGPSRRGGFFGGSGLEGFTGTGGGGFGRVGGFGGGGFGAAGFAGGAGAERAGGFLGLLQDQQGIRNQQASIAALRNSLAQLEAFYNAGRIDFLQVQQARQALFNAQSQLLNAQVAYQDSLDQFKGDLGLPPQLDVVMDDEFVQPFNLIDTAMVPIQNRLTDLQQTVGRTIIGMLPEDSDAPPDGPEGAGAANANWTDATSRGLRGLQDQLAEARRLHDVVVRVNFPRARQDIADLKSTLGRRRQDMLTLRLRLQSQLSEEPGLSNSVEGGPTGDEEGENDFGVMDVSRLDGLPSQLEKMLADLAERFEVSGQDLADLDRKIGQLLIEGPTLEANVLAQRMNAEVFVLVPNELTELSADVLELLLVQARARTESITLVPVELSSDEAFEIARVNRRDWMNARANLVDTWRLIQFNANLLESGLDIVFSGDVSNTGDNPLRLDSNTGRLQVGVQFDAPLTRLSERNTYRLAQIEYQQARRSYYEFVDRIAGGLRETIRTIDLNQLNFELRRAAVQVAIAQVELARLRLQEPPKPEVEAVFGPTTANDLVNALSALLTTQNDFLSVWINYEVQRRSLDFDLGTMQLDADGTWVDPGPVEPSSGFPMQPSGHGDIEPIGPGQSQEFPGPRQSQAAPPQPSRNRHVEYDRRTLPVEAVIHGKDLVRPAPHAQTGYTEPSARRGTGESLLAMPNSQLRRLPRIGSDYVRDP